MCVWSKIDAHVYTCRMSGARRIDANFGNVKEWQSTQMPTFDSCDTNMQRKNLRIFLKFIPSIRKAKIQEKIKSTKVLSMSLLMQPITIFSTICAK